MTVKKTEDLSAQSERDTRKSKNTLFVRHYCGYH